MTEAHTNYIRSIRVPDKGTFEFQAYEKATFIGVWQKDWNGRSTKPHLIIGDCPTKKQLTYRFLVTQGEAPMPIGERWVSMGFVWGNRNSFGTLHMSADVNRKAPPKKAKKEKKAREVVTERVGDEVEAFAP